MIDFQFDTFSDFISMGSHGEFVWSSYGIAMLTFFTIAGVVRIIEIRISKKIKVIKNCESNL